MVINQPYIIEIKQRRYIYIYWLNEEIKLSNNLITFFTTFTQFATNNRINLKFVFSPPKKKKK